MTQYPPPPYSPPPSYSGGSERLTTVAPPRDQPWYGAPFIGATRRGFEKYAAFSGRASRSEFWWWVLATGIVGTVISIVAEMLGYPDRGYYTYGGFAGPGDMVNLLNTLVDVACLVPQLALTWRRLHDTGRSGTWILLALIPIVGWIILIVWLASRSDPMGRRFDRVPSVA